jgi:hypothetical protein
MKKYRYLLSGVLLAAFASIANAGEVSRLTDRLPDVGPPPQGKSQWIARSMRVNGLPMTIKAFQVGMSVEDVLRHYEHEYRGKELNEYVREQRGEWQSLGIHNDRYSITVQARKTLVGAEGTIAVSSNPETVEEVTTRFPHSRSANVVELQEYDDSGIEAEHINFASSRDLTAELSGFTDALRRAGWGLVLSQPAQKSAGHVLEAQKGGNHARLTFQRVREPGAATTITVIWRKA